MKLTCTRFVVLPVLLLVAGCIESTGPIPSLPRSLHVLATVPAESAPGYPLPSPVSVQLVGTDGRGMAGYTVTFTVAEGGGRVSSASVLTDSTGRAETLWTLGPVAGSNRLRISTDGGVSPVVVQTVGRWGPEQNIVLVSGALPALLPGGCTPAPVIARVLDAAGKPVRGAVVDFIVAAGGGSVSDVHVISDSLGHVTTRWTLGLDGNANRLEVKPRSPQATPIAVETVSTLAAPGGYSAIGNKIYAAATCAPHRFYGIARPSLEWSEWGDANFGNIAQDLVAIGSWGANTVRIPLNQSFWVQGTAMYAPQYKELVRQTVAKARALGLNVILDLHVSDRGDPTFNAVPDVQQLPDVRHSVPFWKDVAETFKNDGKVIFELYNEPHDVPWSLWLNGGTVPAGPKYAGGPHAEAFEAAGMQDLYDAVRSTGARNLVIVSGLHWGYFLDEVPQHRVQGYNIAYSTHPYDWPDKQPETWFDAFGFLAATDPIIITEFGAYDCTRLWYYERLIDFADEHGMSWVAWAWFTPPPVSATYSAAQRQFDICKFPSLISDWNGTPSPSGEIIRARLRAAAAR